MGFPLWYSDFLLPKLIFQTMCLLGQLRSLVFALFGHLGLGHLLVPDPDPPGRLPPFQSVSALLIRQLLPVARFDELPDGCASSAEGDCCAVCLCPFEGPQEVRRLTNCTHIFHRFCLDPWLDQDHWTCPLCRALFVPLDLRDDFNEHLWAAAALPDSYAD